MKINKIAVCIIVDNDDNEYLQECLDSIPNGLETIVMTTVPTSEQKQCDLPPILVQESGNVRFYNWNYYIPKGTASFDYELNTFSFSEARNIVKGLTDADIIISLDADERILISDKELLMLANLPPSVGGVFVTVNSMTFTQSDIGDRSALPILRIFRREFDYTFHCHEQVIYAIQSAGLRLIDSTIIIKHIGYLHENSERIKRKTLRNLALISADLSTEPSNKYLLECQWRTIKHAMKLGYFSISEADLPSQSDIIRYINELASFGVSAELNINALVNNIRVVSIALKANPRNMTMLKAQFINLYTYNLLDNLELNDGTNNNRRA